MPQSEFSNTVIIIDTAKDIAGRKSVWSNSVTGEEFVYKIFPRRGNAYVANQGLQRTYRLLTRRPTHKKQPFSFRIRYRIQIIGRRIWRSPRS